MPPKTDGMKEPDPNYPFGSIGAKYQKLSPRDLNKVLFTKDTQIHAQANEIAALKKALTKANFTKACAIEMLAHETACHVATKMDCEDTEGMTKEAKDQRRHELMEGICRERAGDHYALYHYKGEEHYYYGVEAVAKHVYYTDNKSFRDFDEEHSIWGHEQCMTSSTNVKAQNKRYLEASRAGMTATMQVVDISDNSDGDSDMSG